MEIATPGTGPTGPDDGLFRTRLAGRHARTSEAFSALRRTAGPATQPGLPGAGVYGGRIAVSDDPAEGHWELVSIRDDILLSISDCRYARPRTESILPEGFVEFHFMVEGPVSVDFSEAGHIRITSPNLTIVHQGDDMNYRVSCGPGTWRSVGLHVSRDYFGRFVSQAIGPDSAVLRSLHEVANDQIACHQMPVGMAVLAAVEQLLGNPYQGYRRLLYAQAKASEILCASVDLWTAFIGSPNASEVFSARDLRLIEKARDLILSDLSRVPTIPELAQAVGTNTSKLKRGFKFLYGMTVFEFGHRHRMNRALNMLVNERLSIGEVALAVGYQHQTSFTTAFRESFGAAPKDVRRMPNAGDLRLRMGG